MGQLPHAGGTVRPVTSVTDHRPNKVGLTDPKREDIMSAIYEPPMLQEVGDFEELTKCLGVGSCNDFAGCGYAIVCFW
ncbi:hypothetical protein SAMN02787118_103378 [Streptomyces mirabilis]|nr:hypothetical protein SAMN02787118_103378 [Streptomyces mirabilis]